MIMKAMVYNYNELKIRKKEKKRIEKYKNELIEKFLNEGIINNYNCFPDDDYIFNMIHTYPFFKEIIIDKRRLSNEKRKLNKSIEVNTGKVRGVRL